MIESQIVPTIHWSGDAESGVCELIDQTVLPGKIEILPIGDPPAMHAAIHRLSVRGAPAIGVAAAYGVWLGARRIEATDADAWFAGLEEVVTYLESSRPTAVNLSWAARRMLAVGQQHRAEGIDAMREALFAEARRIHEEDRAICHRLGAVGAELIEEGDALLTHCNAGGLATSEYGTALSVMFEAKKLGRNIRVYADETRPLLQGARLTTWELDRAGIDVTLICDNTAATLMAQGKVSKVVVGADRIARNGDVCNKIGTYGVAVLARAHDVPFYCVAPTSTFDLSLEHGGLIPIEERDPAEVTEGFGPRTAPDGIQVYSPAFDVTPAHLVSGIVTENGIIRPVDTDHVVANVTGNHGDLRSEDAADR